MKNLKPKDIWRDSHGLLDLKDFCKFSGLSKDELGAIIKENESFSMAGLNSKLIQYIHYKNNLLKELMRLILLKKD